MERLSQLGKNLAIVAGIGTAISTMGGLAWSLIEDATATREKRIAVRVSELTSFADFGDVVDRYRKEIGQKSSIVVQQMRGRTWNCDSLLDLYGSGSAFYYSDEMENYAIVREFYEDLGLLIRYQALDFDLVYEAIIFPDDFVQETEALSCCISENWFGRGKGVPSFSFNMNLLEKNYQLRRNGEKPNWDVHD